jgi:hypothetical protein
MNKKLGIFILCLIIINSLIFTSGCTMKNDSSKSQINTKEKETKKGENQGNSLGISAKTGKPTINGIDPSTGQLDPSSMGF